MIVTTIITARIAGAYFFFDELVAIATRGFSEGAVEVRSKDKALESSVWGKPEITLIFRQLRHLVEPRGIEPLTSAVRLQRSPI
jgi:hypothetical protein